MKIPAEQKRIEKKESCEKGQAQRWNQEPDVVVEDSIPSSCGWLGGRHPMIQAALLHGTIPVGHQGEE